MKLTVTNEERMALATFLIPAAWSASEETLVNFLRAFDAFGLEEYRPLFNGQAVQSSHPLLSAAAKRDVTLAEGTAKTLLEHWPGHGTPGALGPPKVRLLQRMRAQVKPEKPEKKG